MIKKLISSAVMIGLITLAGCSGSSPSPKPIPTPAADAWGLSGSVSSQTLFVNQSINLVLTVTKNGQPAPDGTTVSFEVSGPVACYSDASSTCAGFSSGKVTQASVATSGGKASILFVSLQAGTFTITGRVGSVTVAISLTYKEPDTTSNLAIFSVVPSQGSLAGGDQVTFFGKGILTPVEVFFSVNGHEFAGQVVSVDSSGLSATVVTPVISGVDTSQGWAADVRFVSGSGTAFEQSQTLPGAFQFLPSSLTPEIYQVFPDHGSARGGEQVTIFGQNFKSPATVQFTAMSATLDAEEVTVSADGRQITVITPQVSAVPLQQDENATLTVISGAGTANEQTVTKADAYVFTADQLTPNISAISPNSGPVTGGTQVTIFGAQTSDSGFQFPVQVTFGGGSSGIPAREAQVVSVNLHQIVCITPDITNDLSGAGVTPPVGVDVTVKNVDSGLEATLEGIFTYGEALFISGNTPSEGPMVGGTLVTIYGSGFQSPLFVEWKGVSPPQRPDVVAVSGSEVVVRMPGISPPECTGKTGTFKITETDSNLTAAGGSFTYKGNNPEILSIDNPTVRPVDADSAITDPTQITITGQNFQPPLSVKIGNYVMPDADVTVSGDGTQITVTNLPSPDDMHLQYNTGSCNNTNLNPPIQGAIDVATPVDVTVTNLTGNCASTLPGGLTYQPWDLTCRIPPTIGLSTNALVFGDVGAGGPCPSGATKQFDISNKGNADLNWSAVISGPDATDFKITIPVPSSGTIAPGDPATTVTVDFCPATTGPESATVDITSNDPNNPSVSVSLSGTGI